MLGIEQQVSFLMLARGSVTEFSRSSLPCQGKSEVEENGAVEIARCSRGQYFGELALVTNKPRAASAHAIGTVKCLGRSPSGGRASPACGCDTCIPWAHVTVPMSSLGPQVLWSPQERTRSRFIALWNPICGSPSFFLYKSSHTILFFRTGVKEHLVLVKNWEYGVLGLIFPIKFVFLKKKKKSQLVFLQRPSRSAGQAGRSVGTPAHPSPRKRRLGFVKGRMVFFVVQP